MLLAVHFNKPPDSYERTRKMKPEKVLELIGSIYLGAPTSEIGMFASIKPVRPDERELGVTEDQRVRRLFSLRKQLEIEAHQLDPAANEYRHQLKENNDLRILIGDTLTALLFITFREKLLPGETPAVRLGWVVVGVKPSTQQGPHGNSGVSEFQKALLVLAAPLVEELVRKIQGGGE